MKWMNIKNYFGESRDAEYRLYKLLQSMLQVKDKIVKWIKFLLYGVG